MLENYLILGDAKIEIRYVEGERRFAAQAFDVLDGALPTITSYFGIAQPFPKVRVILVASRAEFDRLVRDLLGVEIEVPSHPARIAWPLGTLNSRCGPGKSTVDAIDSQKTIRDER